MNKQQFIEESLSRVLQHITDSNRSFAVISAYLIDDENNDLNHEELKKDIRKLNAGFIELDTGYTYKIKSSDDEKMANEKSYFIPGISKRNAIKLGKKYKQESILWKDKDEFIMLGISNTVGIGKTLMKFRMLKNDALTYNKKIVKTAFSTLQKGSKNQVERKIVMVNERRILDFPTSYLYQGEETVSEWIRIF
ncbi:MAG: DUF3293 domain-containing protein [Candidatus Cloacimonetes bacterium]|nr:DUF3293 domain-containing protein [Candidatus Cloacimonadota bacterium]